MDSEAAKIIPSLQLSDEVLESWLDEVQTWRHGRLSARAFAYCAVAWPRVRETALREWREQLTDPYSPDFDSALPTVAWYLAAANRDGAFLRPLLDGWRRDDDTVEILFGDISRVMEHR
jgi:hypothetical protein